MMAEAVEWGAMDGRNAWLFAALSPNWIDIEYDALGIPKYRAFNPDGTRSLSIYFENLTEGGWPLWILERMAEKGFDVSLSIQHDAPAEMRAEAEFANEDKDFGALAHKLPLAIVLAAEKAFGLT